MAADASAPGVASSAKHSYRLQPRFITTDDQMLVPHGFWDTHLELACSFQRGRDLQFRCYPQTNGQHAGLVFQDPLCTKPLLRVCSPETESIVRWRPTRRPFGSAVATADELAYGRLGKQVEGLTRIYEADGKRCGEESWSDASPCRLHRIASTIPLEALLTGRIAE